MDNFICDCINWNFILIKDKIIFNTFYSILATNFDCIYISIYIFKSTFFLNILVLCDYWCPCNVSFIPILFSFINFIQKHIVSQRYLSFLLKMCSNAVRVKWKLIRIVWQKDRNWCGQIIINLHCSSLNLQSSVYIQYTLIYIWRIYEYIWYIYEEQYMFFCIYSKWQ